jgi:hypothetical protein
VFVDFAEPYCQGFLGWLVHLQDGGFDLLQQFELDWRPFGASLVRVERLIPSKVVT